MSPTIDDLRATLDQRGHDVDAGGVDVHARLSGVRHRVAAARRRRAAAVSTAAAVVLAGFLSVGVLTRGAPVDDGLVVAGQDVAEQVSLPLGEYAYQRSVDLDDMEDPNGVVRDRTVAEELLRRQVTLPRAGVDQAVALVASGLDGGTVTLRTLYGGPGLVRLTEDGTTPVASVGTGRTDLVLVLRDVPADAEVALVVYDRSDTRIDALYAPDGSAWFRDEVGGRTRLAGAFTPTEGRATASLTFTGALGSTLISDYCRSDVKGAYATVLVDGGLSSSGGCVGEAGDAFIGGVTFTSQDKVTEHTLEIRVTRGEDGPLLDASQVVAGVAGYAADPDDTVLSDGTRSGDDVDARIEVDGRAWVLEQVVELSGRDSLTADIDLTEEPDARYVDVTYARGRTTLKAVGSVSGRALSGRATHVASGGWMTGQMSGVLLQGERWQVTLARPQGALEEGGGALLVYAPVDE
ncbi:hypothetical protein [Nocardioides bruguierae]|uniref:hypothetical protein n=1 Tax=Nocardioides bruguierae TaxID=2945102 RepID=UPI00202066F9|nr:hypothetical protein [Nocardioides bruguierae]MCL8024059.1 hypothetical protein [Nocardioides bruguierae]